jgi:DNA-binding beta-propeller fold protein YncE
VQIDGRGNALVLDRKARRIVRLDVKGGFAGALEITGLRGPPAVVPAAFKLDGAGRVLVLDVAERRVVEAEAGGAAVREIPVPRGAIFADVAPGPGGQILAVDPVAGSVWVADPKATSFRELARGLKDRAAFPSYLAVQGARIYLADPHGNGIASLGVDGSPQGRELGYGFADGQLQYPGQICATARGEILVADRGNSRVQIFAVTR